MDKIYARLPENKPANTKIEQMPPFNYGNSIFYGWKMTYLKNIENDNHTSEKDKIIQVVDTSKPVEYDNISQLFMDSQNISRLNANLMLENFNQKKINAQMMLEINQLKNGGNK